MCPRLQYPHDPDEDLVLLESDQELETYLADSQPELLPLDYSKGSDEATL